MKSRIEIWTNEKDEHHLITFYDAPFNPLKKGDIFWFSVDDVHPKKIDELTQTFKPEFVSSYIKDLYEKQNKYRHSRFKIIKETFSITENPNATTDEDHVIVVISYYVKRARDLYWFKMKLRGTYFNLKRKLWKK